MSDWMKEPWRYNEISVTDMDGNRMQNTDACRRRAVACVNACRGVEFAPGASVRDLLTATEADVFFAALARFKLKEEKKDG